MIKQPIPFPTNQDGWFGPDGKPTLAFYQYLASLDRTIRALVDDANA